MSFFIYFLYVFFQNLIVAARCCNILMPEHFRNGADIGAVLQQMHCKGVTERLRVDFRFYPCRFGIAAQYFPKALPCERAARTVYENRFFGGAVRHQRTRLIYVCVERFGSLLAERNISAAAAEQSAAQINIGYFKRNKLRRLVPPVCAGTRI